MEVRPSEYNLDSRAARVLLYCGHMSGAWKHSRAARGEAAAPTLPQIPGRIAGGLDRPA
jgi:hypothetical protein